jgi:hypothetical protein
MFGTDKQLRRALWTHVATTLGGTHTFAARDLYGSGEALGHLIKRAGERPRAELDVGRIAMTAS